MRPLSPTPSRGIFSGNIFAIAACIAFAAYSLAFSFFVSPVDAANLTDISDTISTSKPGTGANHLIQYTNATTTNAGETIRITFDPTTDRFDGIQNLVMGNVSTTGMTLVSSCGGGGDEVTFSTSTGVGDESVILTVCGGDSVATGTKTITVGNLVVTNPTSTGSYIIRIGGNQTNNGDTRVAILDDVLFTASVNTSLSFSLSGVASGTDINGVTTTYPSSATSMPFGTLSSGSPVTLGQQLAVVTNAANGFVVTVTEDQNLSSLSGADIDLFANGNATSTPSPWAAPSSTLAQENTYGHIGVTSDDDLNGDEFGTTSTPLFAGNFNPTSTRQVFAHNGPADGLTATIGLANVAFRVQISALQEAATDYQNRITYVTTPTF